VKAQQDLRRERDLTEAIMDTSVAALVIVDADGDISFANEPASDILGADAEALTGELHHEVGTLKELDGTTIPAHKWPFQHVLETGTPISERRYVFERPDGTERYLSVNGAPLRDPDGSLRQVVFSIDDITEQVQYEQELRAAKEEAEQANRLKSAFLANVSHDVQTPLSSILNHADLLRMEASEEHQERIELIKRSGNRLRNTIESVLDLSKLEAGAVEAAAESLDLADELLGTIEIFQPQAAEQEITLEGEVEDPLPATLDPTMVHRITDNLLSNALKFTEPGGTVTLRASGTDDAVTLEVEDTGVGIDESFLPNLFEAFARGPDQNETEGNGLGLAITKHLTDVMGGTIDVDSEKGVGTTFTVRLPR
jgi:PAS domain S-box-containing protein